MEHNIKKYIFYLWLLLVVLAVALLILYNLRYTGMEARDTFIPPFTKPDTLKIPPRPGVQGIVISGPVIEDLIFDIDLRAAGIRPLDWNRLTEIDRTADVTVRARVAQSGALLFNRDQGDIKDHGHPDAGQYIERILNTWVYLPRKQGTIIFYFNVPSRKKKLTIDSSRMDKSDNIPDKVDVRDGLLYYINNLDRERVGYSRLSF